jgi:hypothetical protein
MILAASSLRQRAREQAQMSTGKSTADTRAWEAVTGEAERGKGSVVRRAYARPWLAVPEMILSSIAPSPVLTRDQALSPLRPSRNS